MHNHLSRMLDEFFAPANAGEAGASLWSWNPAVDVYDKDDHIVIQAELPGVDKKDVAVDVKDGMLTIKGERSSDNEVKEEKFYRRERVYGKFERSFALPENVDPDQIKAEYKDGILKIEIPKTEDQKPKQISVH
jgi:HSP20 family protein